MFTETTQIWAAVGIAFLGGTTCWILERIGMESEAKGVQRIISVALSVIFLRYVIEIFTVIQTFGRY